MKLGLVQSKRNTSSKKTGEEKTSQVNIDPESYVSRATSSDRSNVLVTPKHIQVPLVQIFTIAQQKYKFHDQSGVRLHFSGAFQKSNGVACLTWSFYDKPRSSDAKEVRIPVTSVAQRLYLFVPLFNPKEISVVFRTESNRDIFEELAELVSSQGLTMEEIPSCVQDDFSAKSLFDMQADEAKHLDLLKVEQEKEELNRRQLAEKAALECKPLNYDVTSDFDKNSWLNIGSILLGTSEEELRAIDNKNIDPIIAQSVSPSDDGDSLQVTEIAPTREDFNAMGKKLYEKHELHSLLVDITRLVNTHFYAELDVVTKKEARYENIRIPSLYMASDLQKVFEEDYEQIGSLGKIMIKVFPLSHVGPKEDRDTSLRIHRVIDRASTAIPGLDSFNFVFELRHSIDKTDIANVLPSWNLTDPSFVGLKDQFVAFRTELDELNTSFNARVAANKKIQEDEELLGLSSQGGASVKPPIKVNGSLF